jgi:hypothetical protein
MNSPTNSPNYLKIEYLKTCILFTLAAETVWTIICYVITNNSISGVISASRMLISASIMFALRNKINRATIERAIIIVASLNGVVVALQIYEARQGSHFLPIFLKYGGIWGFSTTSDYEVLRKGGLFPSLQTSAVASLVALHLIIIRNKTNFITALITAPLSGIGLIFGSRLVFVLAAAYLSYKLIKKLGIISATIIIAFFFVIAIHGTNSKAAKQIIQRQLSAATVILTMNTSADYSAEDTARMYVLPSKVQEYVFGNGCERYANCGGGDPMITRWYIQSGFPSLLILFELFLLAFIIEKKTFYSGGLFISLMLLHSFKDEVLTSFGFFDIYIAYLFANKQLRPRGFCTKNDHWSSE